jgi:hypothetical protein
MAMAFMIPDVAISRRNLKILMKLDLPAAFDPITTLNRARSISSSEKLLKFSTWIFCIGIHIPYVIVTLEQKEHIGLEGWVPPGPGVAGSPSAPGPILQKVIFPLVRN